jgi:hypothetical protein
MDACLALEVPEAWQPAWAHVVFQVARVFLGLGWQAVQRAAAELEVVRVCSADRSVRWQSEH